MHFISYLLLHNRSSLNDSCRVLSLLVSVDKEFEGSVAGGPGSDAHEIAVRYQLGLQSAVWG